MRDPYNLSRFTEAQEAVYASVLEELASGRKTGHWMWFIFPQLAGLGRSPIAQRYAISSIDEARAYLGHQVLGRRLAECTQHVIDVDETPIQQIFGYPDCLKFRSCMTLFNVAERGSDIFKRALDVHFDGQPDPLTLRLLGISSGAPA